MDKLDKIKEAKLLLESKIEEVATELLEQYGIRIDSIYVNYINVEFYGKHEPNNLIVQSVSVNLKI